MFSVSIQLMILNKLQKNLKHSRGDWSRYEKYDFHTVAAEVISILGKNHFDSYFSFAFVRNPLPFARSSIANCHPGLLRFFKKNDHYEIIKQD